MKNPSRGPPTRYNMAGVGDEDLATCITCINYITGYLTELLKHRKLFIDLLNVMRNPSRGHENINSYYHVLSPHS